jgi:hypothetical protein
MREASVIPQLTESSDAKGMTLLDSLHTRESLT